MKKRLSQRIFDRNVRGAASSARRLSLEALENRELLNADWGGFSSELLNEYASDSSNYSVDISNDRADVCALEDMNGDGVDELATINYSAKTLSVYQSDAAGAFSLVKTSTISQMSGDLCWAESFGDVDGDGIVDLVVVSQSASSSSTALTATVYKGDSSFGFTRASSTTLDVSKFSDGLFFVSLDAALLPNSNDGCDLVVQGQAFGTETGLRQTVLYSGVGSSNFGTSSKILDTSGSATTNDPYLVGSGTVDGNDYLFSIDKTQKKNQIVLSSVGASVVNHSLDLSSIGSSFVAEWVLEQDGVLVVGGTNSGVSGVASIKISSLTDGTFEYAWTRVGDITINSSSCAAIGNMGGSQSTPELFIIKDSAYVVFQGSASATSGYEFEKALSVVANPNYRAVYVGDYDGDGTKETLLIGETNVWSVDVAADGTTGAPTSVYSFDRAVKTAVFGDFNGDNRLDFAVYYQSQGSDVTVGTNLQVFQQTSTGAFVPVASYALSGIFLDFSVGSFTQSGADEIATLRQTASGVQYVDVLRLNVSSSSTSIVGARSFRVGAVGAASLTNGSLFGSAVDDVVLVSPNEDAITVLKNTGTTFAATTYSTNTGLNVTSFNPTAAAIGDVDGDGKNDIVVLNSASGTNRGHIAYFLQMAAGFTVATSNSSLYINGDAPQGLVLNDLNADGRLDVATIQKTTGGQSYLYYFLNAGSKTIFSAGVRSVETTVGVASNGEIVLAKINDDSSFDVALAQGKSFGFYLNGSEGPTQAGSVQFLCQSASSAAGDSFEAATSTARTWLDEWSNFYIDVWASTDGSDALASAVAALQYNPSYFTVSGVEAATGFNVDYTAENGVVSVSATAKAGTSATGTSLIARIRFEPISETIGGVSYFVGGVGVPEDGALASVDSGFDAAVVAQKVNGVAAASTAAPENVALYPVNWDFNEDGTVNIVDFNSYLVYFDCETFANPADDSKYAIYYANGDGKINIVDFNNFISYFDVKATNTADSFYREEPSVVSNVVAAVSEAVVASNIEMNGEELSLVNPSETLAEQRKTELAAVDVALNVWDVDETEELAAAVVENAVPFFVEDVDQEDAFASFAVDFESDAEDSAAEDDVEIVWNLLR